MGFTLRIGNHDRSQVAKNWHVGRSVFPTSEFFCFALQPTDVVRKRNCRIERSMRRFHDILTAGLTAHVMAIAVHAAEPAPNRVPRQIVTLLPQIEELEDGRESLPTGTAPEGVGKSTSEEASQKKPRLLFPNPRLLFRQRSTDFPRTSPTGMPHPEQTASRSPIFQTSGLSPEPIPTLRVPDAEVVPAPTSDYSHELITPESPAISEGFPGSPQMDCVETYRGVVPRTDRPASRLRFPGLSRMFSH
jgi:hypothetical protein